MLIILENLLENHAVKEQEVIICKAEIDSRLLR